MSEMIIREAALEDAEKLLEIYGPYVTDTAITFEYQAPSLSEFQERMRCVQEKYPYLVAEQDGNIMGYVYAAPFKERAAYDWCVETTIYVKKDRKRAGVGRRLYAALEAALALQNILNLNACIGYPEREDAYLTLDSVRFHERLGYRMVGKFLQCGYKFGRWYHMVWMEKHLGIHDADPRPVRPFGEVRERMDFSEF